MKLTPLDVRHQEFAGALSGYNRAAVREFLAQLSDQLEDALREQQASQDQLAALKAQVEDYRAAEDELRRTVVAAERISSEMRASAQREADLMVRTAAAERDRLQADADARRAVLEADHASRGSELEARHRERLQALESDYQNRHHELDRALHIRHAELERAFATRQAETQAVLERASAEQRSFLAQYRALVASFHDLAQQHPLPPERATETAPNVLVEEQQFV